MSWIGEAFAMAPAGGGGEGGGSLITSLMPLALIFGIMYMLIIRPQQKKQKDQARMIESLKKGDEIVTNGGIHGTIVGVKERENTLIVKIAENVKIELSRSTVLRVKESKDSGKNES
ncbi:MAG: preprotein translocase subunit YajC [Candidatus Latescibacterota bacterium]